MRKTRTKSHNMSRENFKDIVVGQQCQKSIRGKTSSIIHLTTNKAIDYLEKSNFNGVIKPEVPCAEE